MPQPHSRSNPGFRAQASEDGDASAPSVRTRALVLVVDDDPDTVEILQWFLHREGFDVSIARSAREALRSVEERLPDVAIIDYMMPGMNGITLSHRLREQPATRHFPIILHTAAEHAWLGSDGTIDRVVTKPSSVDDLVMEVRALLQRRQ